MRWVPVGLVMGALALSAPTARAALPPGAPCQNNTPSIPGTLAWDFARIHTAGHGSGLVAGVDLADLYDAARSGTPLPDVFGPENDGSHGSVEHIDKAVGPLDNTSAGYEEFRLYKAAVGLNFMGMFSTHLSTTGPPKTVVKERGLNDVSLAERTITGAQDVSMVFSGKLRIGPTEHLHCTVADDPATGYTTNWDLFGMRDIELTGLATQQPVALTQLSPFGTGLSVRLFQAYAGSYPPEVATAGRNHLGVNE